MPKPSSTSSAIEDTTHGFGLGGVHVVSLRRRRRGWFGLGRRDRAAVPVRQAGADVLDRRCARREPLDDAPGERLGRGRLRPGRGAAVPNLLSAGRGDRRLQRHLRRAQDGLRGGGAGRQAAQPVPRGAVQGQPHRALQGEVQGAEGGHHPQGRPGLGHYEHRGQARRGGDRSVRLW